MTMGEDPTSSVSQLFVVEDKGGPAGAVFRRDSERRSRSPRVRDRRVLETPKVSNPSRSRIHQPRRPNPSDSGIYLLFFSTLIKLNPKSLFFQCLPHVRK
jgi:hypothetical protein